MPALLTEGILKPHPFLEGASEYFLNELEEFSCEASFEKGEIILSEGGYADKCFLIREGHVQLELRPNEEPACSSSDACVRGPHRLVLALSAFPMAFHRARRRAL